ISALRTLWSDDVLMRICHRCMMPPHERESEVGGRDLLLDAIADAVHVLAEVSGEVQHRLAHGLARDGAGVDAGAADDFTAFHNGDALARLGALDGGALPRWTGPDHDQIVGLH